MAAVMPSEVEGSPSLFDRFATAAAEFVSKAWFFTLCVLLIVLWAPLAAGIAVLLDADADADTQARVRRELLAALGLEQQEST